MTEEEWWRLNTDLQTSERGWGSAQQKRAASTRLLKERAAMRTKKALTSTFPIIHRRAKEEHRRSPPLDKLTCSARKYSCLPPLPRLPSGQNLSGARSHSSICFCVRFVHTQSPLEIVPSKKVSHSVFYWWKIGSISGQFPYFC